MATFRGQAGINNTFTGTAGADLFLWAAGELNSLDRANGAGGSDFLRLTTTGPLAVNALAGVVGIERFLLAAGGNAITLANANFTGVIGARILINGGAGADTVTATAVTGANRIDVTAGAGADVLRGGAGADVFRFTHTELAGDTVAGGAGRDTLLLTSTGAVVANGLRNMAGVELIQLASGGSGVTLLDANFTGVAGAKMLIRGLAGSDTVNASGLTGARAIDVTAGGGLGADVLRGGAGRDTFRFTRTELAGDTISGGGGADQLLISTAGALGGTALTNMRGVETLRLAAGGNSVTVLDANLAEVAGARLVVKGGAGLNANTVDASGLTGANAIDVTAGGGLDVLRGGAGADVFRFTRAQLAGDIIAGGGGTDTVLLTTAGGLPSNALRSMTGVERVLLAAGGNAITLENANFTGVAGAKITVIGGAGANPNTVNASGLTGANAIDVTAGGGLDVLRGGAGNDVFRFAEADLDGDTVAGGGGADTLLLTTVGGLGGTALANVTGVETIRFAMGGNALALIDANFSGVAGGVITVIGGGGPNLVDAAQLTGINKIDVTAGKDTDILTGGAGDDVFRFARLYLTADDTVTGGTGYDILVLSDTGALASDALAGVTGIDRISLAAGGNSLKLTDANFAVPFLGGGSQLSIVASAGSSVIDGSSLTGTNGLTIYDRGGVDTIFGGAGADNLEIYSGAVFAAGDTFDGGAGVDAIFFDRSMDFLGDTIRNVEELTNNGGVAATVAVSGENAARLLEMGSDTLDGVSTVFTVRLTAMRVLNLSNLTLVNADAGDAINVVNSSGSTPFTETFLSSSIASYTGYDGADYVYDRGGVQAISLGGGNDTVAFRAGNLFAPGDTIDGGAGDDTVSFDRSMNFLGDSIKNVEYLAFFLGTGSAEIIISGEIAVQLKVIGLYGNQDTAQIFTVQLAAGSTSDLSNLSSSDFYLGDAINVVATSGNTAVTLNNQFASFTGSDDSDTVALLVGGAYRSGAVIDGGGGDDRIVYAAGAASILGGGGSDTLVLIDGGQEVVLDILSGQVGGDVTVTGFENVDASAATTAVALTGREDVVSRLVGGSAGDTITAGLGGAVIVGGLGSDVLNGNSGDDRFHIRSTAEAAGDTIDGLGGSDGIDVFASADLFSAEIRGIETLYLAAGDGAGTFTNDNLTATLTAAQAESLTDVFGNGYFSDSVETLVVNAGESGADLSSLNFFYWSGNDQVEINGTGGADVIVGSSQNDVIAGGGGDDRLSGGDGNDDIGFYLEGDQNLFGGTGNDTVRLSDNTLFGGGANYTLTVDLGSNAIFVAAPDIAFGNSIVANGFENADLSLSFGSVEITGTNGANTLIGGSDADTIAGGLGADTLTGGGGADSFEWNDVAEGGDTITDFEQDLDKLRFSDADFAVDGAFDTFAGHATGFTGDITGVDYLFVASSFNSAAEIRAYLDTQQTTADHGMFVAAPNVQGRFVLYYTANATAGSFDNTVFEIAGFGAGQAASVTDFVFV